MIDYSKYNLQKIKGDKKQRFVNTLTGETLSYRQALNIRNAVDTGFASESARSRATKSFATTTFKHSETQHSYYAVSPPSRYTQIIKQQIIYLLAQHKKTIGDSNAYGMSLFLRYSPSQKFGTPIIEYGNVQMLIDELVSLFDKYDIDEEEENERKAVMILTIYNTL